MKAHVLKTQTDFFFCFFNIKTYTRFIKVENTHWSKQNMLHLLENMVAVPFEKPQKREDRSVRCPSLREYWSPLLIIAWQQMMANRSKCLTSVCVKKKKNNRKRTKNIPIVRNVLSGSWKVVQQLWQIKRERMTQSSRSRKEQSKRFLERQCVASNSLARTPPPQSSWSTLKPVKTPKPIPLSRSFPQTRNTLLHPKSPTQRSPPPFAPQPGPGQTGPWI